MQHNRLESSCMSFRHRQSHHVRRLHPSHIAACIVSAPAPTSRGQRKLRPPRHRLTDPPIGDFDFLSYVIVVGICGSITAFATKPCSALSGRHYRVAASLQLSDQRREALFDSVERQNSMLLTTGKERLRLRSRGRPRPVKTRSESIYKKREGKLRWVGILLDLTLNGLSWT
jgi:hypothetical protein